MTPISPGNAGHDDRRETGPFLPGSVFAGRYRMVTRIGRGGMGEVWRADDLVLQTPVALKWIYSTSTTARSHIVNEVRLARQITHPAVCRVFDVGEAEGQIFYSMELVEGEDLATLLRRLGRLPVEKVVEIGRQLCDGLSAAHAQGVLHRDLKPANVLIDEDGQVRITDFGIAVSQDESNGQAIVGTLGYMAPEQLVPGGVLSERTDVYALGVVLYELLVGERPFDDLASATAGPPPKPSTLVPDVDPRLDRVVLGAIKPNPEDRPASAAEFAQHLQLPPSVERARRIRPWLAAAAVAAIVGAAAILSTWFTSPKPRPLTDQDTIVLADFSNTTGDAVFDGTLKVALAVALEQSPFLKVFPDERVRETLGLMQRSPDERVTSALARDIARRAQLKALVAGSIASLGSHYSLALEAVNAETGDVVAREQIEAPSKEQVLTSLGTATSRLREKLGESLASVQKFDVPLARATTSSLDALRAYSLALDQKPGTPGAEAIPHLQRAIDLDPNFALAYAQLSGVYANSDRTADAPPYSRKAFDLRDRVSDRERFFISWRYYRDAEQAWDKGLVLSRSWTETYPRESFAFNSLGLALATLGQHEDAVKAFREAVRLDPKFVTPSSNLAGSLVALNRTSDARAFIQTSAAQGVDSFGLKRAAYFAAFIDGDGAAMARLLSLIEEAPEGVWASTFEARTLTFSGRMKMAHALFERGAQVALGTNFRQLAAQWTAEDAELYAISGACADARRATAAAINVSRDNFTLERAARTLALCGADADASRVSNELAKGFPDATITNRLHLPVIAAAIALAQKNPAKAIALLDPVRVYDLAPAAEFWPMYLRGQAFLQAKNGAAAKEFQQIVEHRGAAPTSPLYALAYLGLARAAGLAGDRPAEAKAYGTFLSLWKDADPGLAVLAEARREAQRLQ